MTPLFQSFFSMYFFTVLKSCPRRIEHLLKHLNSKYKFGLDLTFLEQLKARDGYDRLLKILQYLHSGSHTREELSKTFGISERALSDDLNTLKDGFEFMGTTMKISELERGSNTYNSLMSGTLSLAPEGSDRLRNFVQ
ncbi:hypothetical protein ACPUYX_17910 [Desulfosporosinus sp. SYSU MS00001]|uniref:hypothetical protein n=1 Tax=Desulfosporosinus sp. SYSU MS00001 TaxID=3416284 RepID=UPI003CFA6C74